MINLQNTYFSGIAGSGMSALAQYLAMQGQKVAGSDRSLDQNPRLEIVPYLEKLNIDLFPQDGSGLTKNTRAMVISTAIEGDNPEIKKAKVLDIPIFHRSDLLQALTEQKKSIAIAGTSGKSTVTAMIYQIMQEAGLQPSIISGAALNNLKSKDLWGNAHYQKGEWLVFEADESDGTLIKYHPNIGVLLNIDKDHKEMDELFTIFKTFIKNTQDKLIYNHSDHWIIKNLKSQIVDESYHFGRDSLVDHGSEIKLNGSTVKEWSTNFNLQEQNFTVNSPGEHNLQNMLAALCTGLAVPIPLSQQAKGASSYTGIERRFEFVGEKNKITVIDDFAHNPAKISAVLKTCQELIKKFDKHHRLIVIFHIHGYAPLKFLFQEFYNSFFTNLNKVDVLILPEVYYAGGTADKSISAEDLVDKLKSSHPNTYFVQTKNLALESLQQIMKEGDLVLNMGARDPKLGHFAKKIVQLIE